MDFTITKVNGISQVFGLSHMFLKQGIVIFIFKQFVNIVGLILKIEFQFHQLGKGFIRKHDLSILINNCHWILLSVEHGKQNLLGLNI